MRRLLLAISIVSGLLFASATVAAQTLWTDRSAFVPYSPTR